VSTLPPLETPPPFTLEQQGVLKRARAFFGAVIGACVLMPIGVVVALGPEAAKAQANDNQVSAGRAAIAVFIAGAVVAVGLRMQTYKANWQGDAVTPSGYAKAMRRFAVAVCTGLAGACAISLGVGHPAGALYPPIFAVGILVFGFPNGRPMLPQPPELGSRK